MISLKPYQKDAIDSALSVFRYAEECYKHDPSLEAKAIIKSTQSGILLEAPTGSGKTVIAGKIAEEFSRYGKHQHNANIIWFWFAPFKGLIDQTKSSIRNNFHGLNVKDVHTARNAQNLVSGDIFVMTWSSVASNKENRKIRNDTESLVSIDSFIPMVRDMGFRIGVIVDEAHHSFFKPQAKQAREFYNRILSPDYTLSITATPDDTEISKFSLASGIEKPHKISISRQDAVDAGLIKDGVKSIAFLANEQERNLMQKTITALAEGKNIHENIKLTLSDMGIDLVPLMMVQVSNNDDAVSKAKEHLLRLGVHESKIASYTASEPQDDLLTVAFDESKEYLIFKVAAATGFDAPRAFTLVTLRPSKDPNFGIQTIGRILRVHKKLQPQAINNTLPLALRYGYVVLADSEYQEGMLEAGKRIETVKTQMANITPTAMAYHIGGEAKIQYVKDARQPSLMPEPYIPSQYEVDDQGEICHKVVTKPSEYSVSLFDGFFECDNDIYTPVPKSHPSKPKTGYSYPLKDNIDRLFYTERTNIDMTKLISCIINQIDFTAETILAADRDFLNVRKETSDIFTGDRQSEIARAYMSKIEITRRAEQLLLFGNGDINPREIRRPLIEKLQRIYAENGRELSLEEAISKLNMILASRPDVIRKAIKECRAKYKLCELRAEIPEVIYSEYELPPSRLNVYGVMPKDLNKSEKAFIDLIENDFEAHVIWWMRNAPRRPESIAILMENGSQYFPDFIVKVKDKKLGKDGILLVEPKGSHILNDENTILKAQSVHREYGKPLMIVQDGDYFMTVEYDSKKEKCYRDRRFRPELMAEYQ